MKKALIVIWTIGGLIALPWVAFGGIKIAGVIDYSVKSQAMADKVKDNCSLPKMVDIMTDYDDKDVVKSGKETTGEINATGFSKLIRDSAYKATDDLCLLGNFDKDDNNSSPDNVMFTYSFNNVTNVRDQNEGSYWKFIMGDNGDALLLFEEAIKAPIYVFSEIFMDSGKFGVWQRGVQKYSFAQEDCDRLISFVAKSIG